MLLALLILASQAATAQPARFGLPACNARGQELAHRTAYTLCFSATHKTALWTIHEVTTTTPTGAPHRRLRFHHDAQLSIPSARDTDYRNSGFARGHLVPAADLGNIPQAFEETFLLSNAVPQDQSLNQGKWRALENAIRRIAATADSVIVLTGPVLCDTTAIGANQIAVPCELFKIVLVVNGHDLRAYAALLPNSANPSEPLSHFAVAIRDLESRTGFDFFPQLPRAVQDRLESTPNILPSIRQ